MRKLKSWSKLQKPSISPHQILKQATILARAPKIKDAVVTRIFKDSLPVDGQHTLGMQ